MERLLSLIRNKYLIAGAAFVVWMCFFDRYDFATQYSFQTEKNKLEREKAYYTKEIADIDRATKDAQYNPQEIERIAREKYKMKRSNEDIYVITEVQPEK